MKKIPLSTPTMCGAELKYIHEAFDTNWIAPLGPNVTGFENEICKYLKISNAAALSSGTAALHLALRILGIGEGDVVLCQSLTFAATCNPILYEKATPVFIDSEKDTWNMCPDALEKALKKYPKAKAVIPVHLYGTPAKMDEISELCKNFNVPIIEDAAESLGAAYKGKQTGTFGEMAVLSFNGNKIITTSGGGMLVSENEAYIKKALFLSTQARDAAPFYQHSELGFNYRLSNICAGIGRGQLTVLDDRVRQKKRIYEMYEAGFDGSFIKMNPVPNYVSANYWLSCITGVEPVNLYNHLMSMGIEARPLWKPMNLQPLYENYDFVFVQKKPVVNELFETGLCLPSDVKMTTEEQKSVIDIIKLFCS